MRDRFSEVLVLVLVVCGSQFVARSLWFVVCGLWFVVCGLWFVIVVCGYGCGCEGW